MGELEQDNDRLWEEAGEIGEEAANKIKRLERERDALREALKRIADAPAWGAPDRWETTPFEVRQLARAALEAKP